jgi:hypothetical protein
MIPRLLIKQQVLQCPQKKDSEALVLNRFWYAVSIRIAHIVD